jgi:hypothetical protein
MAKIIPGDIEYAYSRMYVVVNPDPALGPPTYRISIPEELSGGGSGNGGGTRYDFDGEPPIVVNTTPGTGTNPPVVKTEMDITLLNNRKA